MSAVEGAACAIGAEPGSCCSEEGGAACSSAAPESSASGNEADAEAKGGGGGGGDCGCEKVLVDVDAFDKSLKAGGGDATSHLRRRKQVR